MAWGLDAGDWTNIGSGVLILALGVGVLLFRTGKRHVLWLASYLMVLGLDRVANEVYGHSTIAPGGIIAVGGVSIVLGLAAAPLLFLVVRAPLGSDLGPPHWVAWLTGGIVLVGALAVYVTRPTFHCPGYHTCAASGSLFSLWWLLGAPHTAILAGGLVHWAIAAQRGLAPTKDLALISLGLGLPAAFGAASWLMSSLTLTSDAVEVGWTARAAMSASWPTTASFVAEVALGYARVIPVFMVAGAWLWATGSGPEPRTARRTAWAFLAFLFIGQALDPVWDSFAGTSSVARVAGVVVLAFAMLRHQLFDLDLTLKWTVKQSTVAGIFVAVIFVASEGAQTVFGDDKQWLGLGVGALLVFALNPLQSFGERVGTMAVPGARDVHAMDVAERENVYLHAAQAAWEDGTLNMGDRAMLERLRRRLELAPDDAVRIEAELA